MFGETLFLSSSTGGRNMAALADCLILSDQKGPASASLSFPHNDCIFTMTAEKQDKDVTATVEKSEETSHETVQEVLHAAGVAPDADDSDAPCLTLRMWILGIGFCVLGSGLNTLYTLRKPSITLSQSAIQLLAYPFGKLWEKVMPNWHFRLWKWTIHLNPGPFNRKVCPMAPHKYGLALTLRACSRSIF